MVGGELLNEKALFGGYIGGFLACVSGTVRSQNHCSRLSDCHRRFYLVLLGSLQQGLVGSLQDDKGKYLNIYELYLVTKLLDKA